MCHTVTGLPHLKVEDIILLHLVLMLLAQLVNCEAPEQLFFHRYQVGPWTPFAPESQLSRSMHLMDARKLLDEQQPQWKLRRYGLSWA